LRHAHPGILAREVEFLGDGHGVFSLFAIEEVQDIVRFDLEVGEDIYLDEPFHNPDEFLVVGLDARGFALVGAQVGILDPDQFAGPEVEAGVAFTEDGLEIVEVVESGGAEVFVGDFLEVDIADFLDADEAEAEGFIFFTGFDAEFIPVAEGDGEQSGPDIVVFFFRKEQHVWVPLAFFLACRGVLSKILSAIPLLFVDTGIIKWFYGLFSRGYFNFE